MGSRCFLVVAVLVAILAAAPSAPANNQSVTSSSNVFTPSTVTVFQGETVTWNNTGGTHNVHFDDNSYVMPNPASSSAWTRSRKFNTPGSFRYYCDLHGGPGGSGMSGIVNVTAATGYARPKGATPFRASLAPAYKPCAGFNRAHGGAFSFSSCNPPVQTSDFATVGSPDANAAGANSIGSVTLKVLSPADVTVLGSITDVRKKSDATDYTGELQVSLPLRITDKLNGPAANENGTGNTSIAIPMPCAATGDTLIGSNCSITTSVNAILPGAAVDGSRAIWEVQGQVQVFDGGPDGLASTTSGNTLFANQAIFAP